MSFLTTPVPSTFNPAQRTMNVRARYWINTCLKVLIWEKCVQLDHFGVDGTHSLRFTDS